MQEGVVMAHQPVPCLYLPSTSCMLLLCLTLLPLLPLLLLSLLLLVLLLMPQALAADWSGA